MGPVFSIAFLVPLVVGTEHASGNGAGNAAALAVLIAAIGVMGLGWIVAEYTRKIQKAGSLYDYVTDGLGGRVGTAAGWLYYMGILALGAGILPMIGGTIHDTILSEFNVRRCRTSRGTCSCSSWSRMHHVPRRGALDARAADPGADLGDRRAVFSVYMIVKSGGLHHIPTGFSPSSSPTH